MTRRGGTLLLGAALSWGLGRFFGIPELYVVTAATVAFLVLCALAVRLSSTTVSARRHVSAARLTPGATSEVLVELRNDSRLPAGLLLVEDECRAPLRPRVAGAGLAGGPFTDAVPRFVVPGLASGRMIGLSYELHPSERGRYEVGPLRVRVRDPFGLCERVQRYVRTDTVIVYPPVEALGGGLSRGTHQGSEASDTRRLFNTGHEFYALREYVTGDDIRQVHWPSTAHRGTLMVRQLELPWQPEATILCDTRASAHTGVGQDATLEKAVSVAASLAWYLGDQRYELRLLTDAAPSPPAVEARQQLLDRLAEVGPSTMETLGPALRRLQDSRAGGLLVAVVAPPPGPQPCAAHPDTRALLHAGHRWADRAAFIVGPRVPADTAGGDRAEQLAALLGTAGWKAVVVRPGESLADRWSTIADRRSRR